MRRVIAWRDVAVALDGPSGVVSQVLGQLPGFFDLGSAGAPIATATVTEQNGSVYAEVPDELSVAGPAGAETARAIASRLELFLVNRCDDFAAVHAGVVAVDGRAIVLPGSSMSGKSTLVRALVEAGATYLSDEYALLDADGAVHAYPRRMTVRTATGSERVDVPGSRGVDADPLPVGVVALLTYEGAGDAFGPVSGASAVLGLTRNSVNVRRRPEQALPAFGAAVESARCLAGLRGEAAGTARGLRALVACVDSAPPARGIPCPGADDS